MLKLFQKDTKIINTQDALDALCKKLKTASKIAIDTEFLRERTYYLLPCLMQIAFRDEKCDELYDEKHKKHFEKHTHCYAVDLLEKSLVFDDLKEILQSEEILKIFHAGDQDIELIYEHFNIMPNHITDTQIMSNFCYVKHNSGYSNLVKILLNKTLNKEKQRSNWRKRPLSDEQVEYALTDVKHLIDIHDIMHQKLDSLQRSKWIKEEVQQVLLNIDRYKKLPEQAWEAFNLSGRGKRYVQIIKRLSSWRETVASRMNLPLTFVMKNSVINQIALTPPKTMKQLSALFGTRDIFKLKLQKKLLEQIKESEKLEIKDDDLVPDYTLTDTQTSVRDFLETVMKIKTREEQIFYEFVFTKNILNKIAYGQKPITVLKNWRYEAFGQLFNDLLNYPIRVELNSETGVNLMIENTK